MRISAIALAIVLLAGAAAAQRHKVPNITETPDGQLLRQITNEQDEAKKLALLEDFAARFPQHEGLPWIFEQMVASYSKASQLDKAMNAGARLLALDPQDVVSAHNCLKAAEAKKDPGLILKWSQLTSDAARKVAATPKPAEEDAVDDWQRSVDFAKQVDIYTEYSLYAALLQTPDPAQKVALGEALEQRNPNSQYLPQMAEQRFLAYVQAGQGAKGVEFAERTIEKGNASVEMLLAVAYSSRNKEQFDRAIDLSKKAAETAEAKPKPEGVADAQWNTWKTQVVGRAHWTAGLAYIGQSKWAAADQELRAALPAVRGNNEIASEALFYLGFANYQLAEAGQTQRAADALRFSAECSQIPGRFQAAGAKNVKAIRAKYSIR